MTSSIGPLAAEAPLHCMTPRGVEAAGVSTRTTATLGLMRNDPAIRSEFLRATSTANR